MLGRVLVYSNSFVPVTFVPVTTKWWNELPKRLTMLESQSELFGEFTKYKISRTVLDVLLIH